MLNKKRIFLAIIAIIIIVILIIGTICKNNKEYIACNLELASNQKLIDYTLNEYWLFAIIEERDLVDQELYKRYIYIYKLNDSSSKVRWEKVAEYDFTTVWPWKIELGNLDYTDGPQIVMGVNKSTYFDEEVSNRLFVFNWDGKKLYKKWTGTRLGYYLKDFYIMDLLNITGEELVVIDQNQYGEERLLVYYWLDFGFQLLAESDFYDIIENARCLDNNLLEITYRKQGEKLTSKLIIKGGWIIEDD